MFDPIITASRIEEWPALTTLPAPLTKALAIFRAIADTAAPAAAVDWDKVTPGNAPAAAIAYAEQHALAAGWAQAHRVLLAQAADRVLATTAEHVDEILAALTPKFLDTARTFTDSVLALPPTAGTAELVAAGPTAVGAYHAAVDSQRHLLAVRALVLDIADLPNQAADGYDRSLTMATPQTAADVTLIDAGDGSIEGLDPVLVATARLGLDWALRTPRQADELRRELTTAVMAS
ncbi:MAG: hypothetical protein O2892_09100 [Actinomycetota bacterium]|nr:hypothetical protein [Actinomycetota bacterium]MDA2949185.1 hypothetical protein [Actinomycetota bacterium]